jgi:hypothetical protein
MSEQYRPLYRALISMRHKLPTIPGVSVKFPSGEDVELNGEYRNLNPGDPIPGAEKWPNPYLWWKRKYIERLDGKDVQAGRHGDYVPPQPSTEEDTRRALEPGPRRESPFQKAGPGDIGPSKDSIPAVVDPSDEEMDAPTPEAQPIDPSILREMSARSRKELLSLAEKAGLKINGNESKADIAKSLLTQ